MVSNMDSTGTFEMAKALTPYKAMTCIHKHYTVDEWVQFAAENEKCLEYVSVSAGTSAADLKTVAEILERIPKVIKNLKIIFV